MIALIAFTNALLAGIGLWVWSKLVPVLDHAVRQSKLLMAEDKQFQIRVYVVSKDYADIVNRREERRESIVRVEPMFVFSVTPNIHMTGTYEDIANFTKGCSVASPGSWLPSILVPTSSDLEDDSECSRSILSKNGGYNYTHPLAKQMSIPLLGFFWRFIYWWYRRNPKEQRKGVKHLLIWSLTLSLIVGILVGLYNASQLPDPSVWPRHTIAKTANAGGNINLITLDDGYWVLGRSDLKVGDKVVIIGQLRLDPANYHDAVYDRFCWVVREDEWLDLNSQNLLERLTSSGEGIP